MNGASTEAASEATGEGQPQRSWLRRLSPLVPLFGLGLLVASGLLVCPAKLLTGVPCPGCGLTRATLSMVHLQFDEMLSFHPLAPLITPMIAWMALRPALVAGGWIGREAFDPFRRVPRWLWASLLVLVLGVWVARLLGGFGGHPDGVDPASGLVGIVFRAIAGGA